MINDEVKQIRERIVTGFSINRIPSKEKDWFIQFAKEEFCDDRGFALKHLIDFYNGLIPSGIEHVEGTVLALEERVKVLEEANAKPIEKKVRKSLDGRTRIGDK